MNGLHLRTSSIYARLLSSTTIIASKDISLINGWIFTKLILLQSYIRVREHVACAVIFVSVMA